MYYANGRVALVGDPVIGKCYNTPGIIAGTMKGITPGTDTCNCTVVFVVVGGLKEDYSQCDNFYHAEDAFEAIKPKITVPGDVPVS